MSYTAVTITGKILLSNSTPASGASVNFTLNAPITDGTSVVAPETLSSRCATDGTFTITLNANDDTSTTPTGTYYAVSIGYGTQTLDAFNVIVPHASAPTVGLFTLAQLTNPNVQTPYVQSFNGRNGAVTLTVADLPTSVVSGAALGTTSVQQTKTAPGAAAPQQFMYDAATFDRGIVDPIWKIGYNPDRGVTTEPAWFIGIEGDYATPAGSNGIWFSDGAAHDVNEWYVEYRSKGGSVDFRPIYCGALRDDDSTLAGCVIFDIGTAGFPKSQLFIKAGASTIMNVTGSGVFVPTGKTLQVGGVNVKLKAAAPLTNYGFPWALHNTTTPTANNLYSTGVQVTEDCTLTGISFVNGGTVTGNVMVALYNSAGTQVAVSASTAQAGTFAGQAVPFTTPYVAAAGVYYVAIIPSSSTSTFSIGRALAYSTAVAQGGFTVPASITLPTATNNVNTPIMSTY